MNAPTLTVPRILFIDDSPDDILLATNALRRDGLVFEQTIASTLEQAKESLARGGWSAILCDYNLGTHTGLDVLNVIREGGLDVPFLLLSGTIGEERAAEAIRQGAADYVMKDRLGRLASSLRRELATADARRTRVALERRLLAFEERYRKTVERAPIGIVNADPNGIFISVNACYCEILGYSASELLGRHFNEFSFGEDAAHALVAFQSLLDGGDAAVHFERRYVRKDGQIVWSSVTLAPVRDDQGAVEYVIGLVEDITARREARQKLLMQARLLDCVEQAVIATDLGGQVVYWNGFAETLYGWRTSEAIGRNVMEMTPAAERGRATEVMESLQRGERWAGEMLLQRRDGTTFQALVMNTPMFDEHETLIGVVGVSHDLTEQKRVENELRQHRLQLAEAQNIARIGSWTNDFVTGERYWSEAILQLWGVEPGAPFSMEEAFASVHPDDRPTLQAAFHRAHATFEPGVANFRLLGPDGQRDILLRYSFELDANGEPVKGHGVAQDVTEARQLEDELLRRTVQQSAVAALGQCALSGASTIAILQQAVASVETVLELHCASILRHSHGKLLLAAGRECEDMHSATSGSQTTIYSADGSAWGILGGGFATPRTFAAYDVEFLRSIATVVGQTVDREDSDVALKILAQRQSAIAEMGQLVLTSVDDAVFDRACELLMVGTGADFAFVSELTLRDTLRPCAGRFWGPNPPDELAVNGTTQIGATVLKGAPVVVHDYRLQEFRDTSAFTVPHGILSGAMVPVAGATRVHGVLSVQSRSAHVFRTDDVEFMQSLANVLAEAQEREHAREQLEESEQRYRRIFEGANEIIFSMDPSGRLTTLNPAFETITGFPRERFLGRAFTDAIVGSERVRVMTAFREMIERRSPENASLSLIGVDGPIAIEISSFVRTENDEVSELYGFARDVNEARRVEAERERVTRSLQLLLESTVEGIYTLDLEGRCTMVNRAAARFIGLPATEIVGRYVHELVHERTPNGPPAPIDDWFVRAVLLDGESRTSTSDVYSRTEGTVVPVAYSAAPIIDNGQRVGAVVTFTDLTERRKLEAQLEQANRLTSLGRLAATVAHEFNNVLMGIAPFVEVIRREISPQSVALALDHIGSAVKRGGRITEDILRFTQPAEPVRAPVDIDAWLSTVGVEARSLLGTRYEVQLHTEKLWIEGDASQLHQIFMNLILNARDAMPDGGTITLTARHEREDAKFPFGAVDDPSRYVHLIAADTGCGMSEQTLRHAFEPLYTTKRSGTGLGLAVTHQVVRRHGGEIFIESARGTGTAFHIFLPRGNAPAELAVVSVGERQVGGRAREILLVEDDPSVALGLTALLEAEGFVVRVAGTGREALASLREAPPDAVVLDVGLPDMDGKAVFAQISATYPVLPVIFSTGHTDRGGLEALLTRPSIGYLLKPYDAEALLDTLEAVMSAASEALS